jgi:hypothetical protein
MSCPRHQRAGLDADHRVTTRTCNLFSLEFHVILVGQGKFLVAIRTCIEPCKRSIARGAELLGIGSG